MSFALPLPAGIVDYFTALTSDLPPVRSAMYEYWTAGNGVFIRARRDGLEAIVQVATGSVRGLQPLSSYCLFSYPRVPAQALQVVLSQARQACDEEGKLVEALFHIEWHEGEWRLWVPDQVRSGGSVKPVEAGAGSSYASALIEVHSHHQMQAFFSGTDDRDEQGFRLYGVIGDIFRHPTLRLRVGIYGAFMEISPGLIFELPSEINEPSDAVVQDLIEGDIDDVTGLWLPDGSK